MASIAACYWTEIAGVRVVEKALLSRCLAGFPLRIDKAPDVISAEN